GQVGEVGTHRGRAGDDAVEVARVALGHDHRLAAARGAADEVRVIGCFTVVSRHYRLAHGRDLADRLVEEVQRGFLLVEEARVEDLALVPTVGGNDGVAAGQRGLAAGSRAAERKTHVAIQATPALEQESAVPVLGQRYRK